MGTAAIFHCCGLFPPFPKPGSKCPDRKAGSGACGRAGCRKQAQAAAPELPSVLPHCPAPRAVSAAPLLTQPGDSGAGPAPPPVPFSTAASCLCAPGTATQRGLQPGVRVSRCVPTLAITSCLSLPPVGKGRCVKARFGRGAVPAELFPGSREGQCGGGQAWSCAGPLTTPGVHRVRRPGPPTNPPAALRSPIPSS